MSSAGFDSDQGSISVPVAPVTPVAPIAPVAPVAPVEVVAEIPNDMDDVIILNTGGTFTSVQNRDGVREIVADRIPEVQACIERIVSARFPALKFRVCAVDDDEFSDIWTEEGPWGLKKGLFDSSALTPAHWNVLAKIVHYKLSPRGRAVVIIHGTDSLAYTAAALSFMVLNRSFPIVITGSQDPLFFPATDAVRNLVDSVAVALYTTPFGNLRTNGVHVCFFGKIMRGVHVVKVSSSDKDAFDSPRFAPVGSVNEDGRVVLRHSYIETLLRLHHSAADKVHTACKTSSVLVVKIYPGVRLDYLKFVASSLRCVLFIGLGTGNGPSDAAFKDAIIRLLNKKVFVVVASDCIDGRASSKYQTSIVSYDDRIVGVENMTTEAAYAKIMVALENRETFKTAPNCMHNFKKQILRSWAGEFDF